MITVGKLRICSYNNKYEIQKYKQTRLAFKFFCIITFYRYRTSNCSFTLPNILVSMDTSNPSHVNFPSLGR